MPPPPGRGGHGGLVLGAGSGSETPVSELLEQLAELWQRDYVSSVPLHRLFSPLTVTAVLKASDTQVGETPSLRLMWMF